MELIKTKYKQTEVGMIPEDWKFKSIEELTPQNKKNGIVDGPFGSNLKTIHYRKSGIPIITSGYVTNGYFFANEYLYVDIDKFKQEKRSSVKGGDIVMAKIGERCGACAILPKNHPEGILSGNALKITIDESKYSSSLIWQILYNNYVTGKLEILRTTGAQPALSMANLKKFPIPLPPTLAEQTAIATALSDADAWISSLEKLIAKKRLVKQGAMQELLKPKEGWEVKSLREVGEVLIGLTYSPADVADFGTLVLRSSNIQKNKLAFTNNVFVNMHIPDRIYVKENDLLICVRNGSKDLIGKCALIDKKTEGQAFGAFMSVFRSEINKYLFYVFQSNQIQIQIDENLGATINQLTNKVLKSFLIALPTQKERDRIASILSDMDIELDKLEEKLAKAKQVKQGMMQELLTGRVRLI
jgi:type I restriction enzyme S subunit